MTLRSLLVLIRRDLVRVRGALVTSGFGIAAGTAALVFFLALGLGVRTVLLGEVFPIDQVVLEPPKGSGFGQMTSFLLGGKTEAPRITGEEVDKLRDSPHTAGVYPKLRMSFPSKAHGGKELLGRNVGSSEMIADGIEPELVQDDVVGDAVFRDPLAACGEDDEEGCKVCADTRECPGDQYCEGPVGSKGVCVDPVPVLVSRYLVEIFDKSIAPTHGFPQMGERLIAQAQGIVFRMWLGESILGKAKKSGPRQVHARMVGISPLAIDLGVTLPIDTVRRWNREFTGDEAATAYSNVLVKVDEPDQIADVVALGETMELSPKDTRARDVSVLLSGVMALLVLVAAIILLVSASNIAYTFRVLVNDRRREIALYRAVGASAGDMVKWLLGLALTVGVVAGAVGVGVAYGLSFVADELAADKLPDFPFKPETFFAFPWWLSFGALGFAALFALLGAFGPARRAGKVDPAAALASLQ